jgi:hypothetical protein
VSIVMEYYWASTVSLDPMGVRLSLRTGLPRGGPRPPRVHTGPPRWEPDPFARGPDRSWRGPDALGRKMLKPWPKARQGSSAGMCLDPTMYGSAPYPGRDAATWPSARDVSQRAEPDVRTTCHGPRRASHATLSQYLMWRMPTA